MSGKVFDLQIDEIEYESGNKSIREVAIHPGGAVVAAVKDDGKIILVKQFRYPFQKFLLELPAGKLNKDEDPLLCARRELEEETGYTCEKIIKLGNIFTTPGFCTEVLHIYLAEKLKAGNHKREEGELSMQVLELSLEEIESKIKTGEIADAKTICGIYYYKNILSQNNLC
jgi:ADP-ribose pyrophosphatase